jgi:hypothetical protein
VQLPADAKEAPPAAEEARAPPDDDSGDDSDEEEESSATASVVLKGTGSSAGSSGTCDCIAAGFPMQHPVPCYFGVKTTAEPEPSKPVLKGTGSSAGSGGTCACVAAGFPMQHPVPCYFGTSNSKPSKLSATLVDDAVEGKAAASAGAQGSCDCTQNGFPMQHPLPCFFGASGPAKKTTKAAPTRRFQVKKMSSKKQSRSWKKGFALKAKKKYSKTVTKGTGATASTASSCMCTETGQICQHSGPCFM